MIRKKLHKKECKCCTCTVEFVTVSDVLEMFGVGSELLSVFGIAATAGMAIGTLNV